MEPDAGDEVTVRVRTARANVDEVWLVSGGRKLRMHLEKTRGVFDYYKTSFVMPDQMLLYYFEIWSGKTMICLLRSGVAEAPDEHFFFRVCPNFHTPAWAKGAVMYQIFTDRFCNGSPENDPLTDEYRYIGQNIRHVDDWDRRPESMDVRNFYGGDLEGVRQKLDYLQNLGVEVLYFNYRWTHGESGCGALHLPDDMEGKPGGSGCVLCGFCARGARQRYEGYPGRRLQPLRILQPLA